MDEISILFDQIALIVVSATAALAGIALATRALWQLTTRIQRRDRNAVSTSDFQRLETAVDAIAVEVERISEAQRFSAALLQERIPARDAEHRQLPSASAPPSQKNTPH